MLGLGEVGFGFWNIFGFQVGFWNISLGLGRNDGFRFRAFYHHFFSKNWPSLPFLLQFFGFSSGRVCNFFFFKFGLGFRVPHPSLKWWYIFSTFNIFLLKFRVYFLFARNVKVLRKFNIWHKELCIFFGVGLFHFGTVHLKKA